MNYFDKTIHKVKNLRNSIYSFIYTTRKAEFEDEFICKLKRNKNNFFCVIAFEQPSFRMDVYLK